MQEIVGKALEKDKEERYQGVRSRGDVRFRMLEVVREYALDRLEVSGEAEEMRRHHAAYFLAFAEEAEPHLQGAQPAEWLNRLEEEHELFDVSQRCVEPNNVGSEILAIRAHVLVRAARLKLVVSAIAVIVVDEPDIIDGLREHIVRWPLRRRKCRWRRNQAVVGERKSSETVGDACYRHVLKGAACGAAPRVPHRVLAGCDQVVGEDQSIHWRILGEVPRDDHVAGGIREPGDVIDGDGVERVLGPSVRNLEQAAAAHVVFAEVVDDHVMNAPAFSRQRWSTGAIRRRIREAVAIWIPPPACETCTYRIVTSVTWHSGQT